MNPIRKSKISNGVKVLGIAGSPRIGGNSEVLLDSALAGAESAGAKTEKIVLSMLKITPCDSDSFCRKNGTCYIKDDMQLVYKKLKAADAIIISSPVYFGSVTAQLKAMIDRCQVFWVNGFLLKKKPSKKQKGLFLCVSSRDNKSYFWNSRLIIDLLFKVMKVKFTGSIYAPKLESKGDILLSKALLKRAFSKGKNLIICN